MCRAILSKVTLLHLKNKQFVEYLWVLFLLKYFLRELVQESFLPAALQADQNLYMLPCDYLPHSILEKKSLAPTQ